MSIVRVRSKKAGSAVIKIHTAETAHYKQGEKTFNLTINKIDATVIAPSIVDTSFVYNGESHIVASGGSVSGGIMQFGTSENDTIIPTEWIDGTTLSLINSGNYHIWYRIVGDTNHNDVDPIYLGLKSIEKATGSISKLATEKSKTYNGNSDELVTAAVGTGTIYYSLDNSTWSTSIPVGKNAGTYTVYYYSEESDNYTKSETKNVSVTISQSNGAVTISTSSLSWSYSSTVTQSITFNAPYPFTLYYSTDYGNFRCSSSSGKINVTPNIRGEGTISMYDTLHITASPTSDYSGNYKSSSFNVSLNWHA